MRKPLLGAFMAAGLSAFAQTPTARFIEVLVTDTVHLPFIGMDYEAAMPDPMNLVTWEGTESEPSEKQLERMIKDAEAKAKSIEDKFMADMAAGGFTVEKASTAHTEDYQFGTGRTFDVNTYRITLKAPADFERFNTYMQANTEVGWNAKDMHFGPPDAEAPRLMRKLYDQAQKKAQALVAVAGGKLGPMISAQEVKRDEGSFLEQLFKMDKMGGSDEETLRMLASSHTSSMAFRFELQP